VVGALLSPIFVPYGVFYNSRNVQMLSYETMLAQDAGENQSTCSPFYSTSYVVQYIGSRHQWVAQNIPYVALSIHFCST
jgi:hypothetical protein